MLPTVAVAHDGARALLLLTLASTAHSGLEDPCKYTPDGFERPRSPCGANGICSVTSTWSELVPHQRTFNCTCVGNYVGDRCEKCDHGYTFRSGCEEKAREHESMGFVLWASILGSTAIVAALIMLAIAFHQKCTDDPGILYSKMEKAGDDQVVLMKAAGGLVAPRRKRKQDICYYCKQPGHWKVNCPVLAKHTKESSSSIGRFATAADYEASVRQGTKLQP